MNGDIESALGIGEKAAQKPAPETNEVLLSILAESQRQTRHLRAIRWMLAIAWLVTLLGGLRVLLN